MLAARNSSRRISSFSVTHICSVNRLQKAMLAENERENGRKSPQGKRPKENEHHACKLGCEGIVSKRLGSQYHSGRSADWIKVKNPASPAVMREAAEERG